MLYLAIYKWPKKKRLNFSLNCACCICFPTRSIKHSDKYSQLILTSPSAADTGPYSCWPIVCDGSDCEKDHDRTYVSYIYFTGHSKNRKTNFSFFTKILV